MSKPRIAVYFSNIEDQHCAYIKGHFADGQPLRLKVYSADTQALANYVDEWIRQHITAPTVSGDACER